MICPVDSQDMIVVEHDKIELDYCTACHGVWFDAGELEVFLAKMKVETHTLFMSDALSSPEAVTNEARRKCPICHKKMKKANVGEGHKVLLDVCPSGHGVWFDGGEIEQLASSSHDGDSSHEQVHSYLSKVFHAPK